MKLFIVFICMVFLLSGCGAQKLPEDSSSLPESKSSLSQAESELSSLLESSSQPEESSLSSQGEAPSSEAEPEESGLLSEVDSSAAELNLEEETAGFEKNYYETIDPALFDDAFYEAYFILEGGRIDSSKIVEVNGPVYTIHIIDEFDAFISDFESGKPLSEMIEPHVYYSTLIGSTIQPEGETALLDKDGSRFKVDSVVSDSGTDFYFPSDKTLLSQICKLYEPEETTVQYVNLNPAGEGILFSDGKQEHIVFFYTAFVPGLEKGVLYSASYVMSAISAERDDIAHPPVEMEVNSDGEINAVTG